MIRMLILTTVLQSSDPDWLAIWRDGDWLTGVFEPFVWLLGEPTVILLLGTPLTLGLWIQTESIVIPGVILALFMGLLISGAPAGATIIGYVIVVLAVAIGYSSISGGGGR